MPEMPAGVLSNTSPLQYVYQLGQLHLLPEFYQLVIIPPTVDQERAAGRARGVPLPIPATLPWVHVQAPQPPRGFLVASTLGRGERGVLALALERPNALVRLDDGRARRFGQQLGLRLTGTVGVLARATRTGRISHLAPCLDRLADLGFRLSAQARATALALVGEQEAEPPEEGSVHR